EEHRTAVQAVRFSRDGSQLASGSSDNTIGLWNAESTLSLQKKLHGHNQEVRAVSFSHDGRYLASGSADKDLFVWNLETHSIEGESCAPAEIDGIEWYPDTLAFISSDGTGAIARYEVSELDTILAPFNSLLQEIQDDTQLSRKDELLQKYENLVSQFDEETLRDKRLFYVNWQCKKALGLLKTAVRRA
ncbi:MAG: hypothetical protein P1Q69_11880, partial [Candidatus Thorarchaeota archaeon]|nr:hypothetical protein [Candidatus Thorarchaeota archaeon]